METNLISTLNDIKDRCFIYSIMLTEASAKLNTIKYVFKLPAIFISMVLSVINSSKFSETQEINVINSVFNGAIALMIGVENALQIDNKRQVFMSTKNKFEKLHSNIEKRLLNVNEPLSVEFVQNSLGEFELIDDDLTFDIPQSIRNKTKKEFFGKRTLPLILGGEKKSDDHQEPQLQALQISDVPEASKTVVQKIPLRNTVLPRIPQLSQLPQPSQLPQLPQLPQQAQQMQELYQKLPIAPVIQPITEELQLTGQPTEFTEITDIPQQTVESIFGQTSTQIIIDELQSRQL